MNEDIDPSGGGAIGEPDSSGQCDVVLPDRESLNDAMLAMVRLVGDGGARTDLDQAMKIFGISRDDLESEIDVGVHET
ncbi:hypothetical protein [Brevibacterium sp. RIT 803]|uniref:hypothetical protein n=1 Tax=Brevibacterium sp. RIT 803 TaxID=2810210 RepID=UPI001951EEF8|nr:hypothetical protein [Brevibacterium sp. RIT 803]MBM6589545.1 hypothetical protein [Brevibacterium sp. RIT 803]